LTDLKILLSVLRWGKLTPPEREKLNDLTLKEVFLSPYLIRKY
jgi:hypothetical protein